MSLFDQVFETRNLCDATKAVGSSLQEALRYKIRPSKAAISDAESLVKRPQERALAIQGKCREPGYLQFRRLVKAIPKGSSRHVYPRTALMTRQHGRPERPISLFTIDQRIVFRALLEVLWPQVESIVVPSVCYCTFRKADGLHEPRGIVSAVKLLRDVRRAENAYIFETDIEGFFDRIERRKLLAVVKPTLNGDDSLDDLLEAVLHAETTLDPKTMGGIIFDPSQGVPQGSALSPLLACAYLSPFDEEMAAVGLRLIRYVDDLVVVCASEEEAGRAQEHVRARLKDGFNLDLKEPKTHIVKPGETLHFLGHKIDGENRLLPGDKRMKSVSRGVYERVSAIPALGDKRVAGDLTSYLLGFIVSMSHCDMVDGDFAALAHMVRKALVARGLSVHRLDSLLPRCSRNWPKPFIEVFR